MGGTIEAPRPSRPRLGPKDLTVHEWGVFSTFNDAQYANTDSRPSGVHAEVLLSPVSNTAFET